MLTNLITAVSGVGRRGVVAVLFAVGTFAVPSDTPPSVSDEGVRAVVIAATEPSDAQCYYFCNLCYIFPVYTGLRMQYAPLADGTFTQNFDWDDCIMDVLCPNPEVECTGLDAVATADVDALWQAARMANDEKLIELLSHKGVELNEGRRAIQAVGCNGNVVAHIPLTDHQFGQLSAALAAH